MMTKTLEIFQKRIPLYRKKYKTVCMGNVQIHTGQMAK